MLAGLTVLATALYVVGDSIEAEVKQTLAGVSGWAGSLGGEVR
jgi:hypothetical protein